MVNDKMAVRIIKDSLMIRIDPELYQQSLVKKGCGPIDFTGKILKGFLLVDPIGIDSEGPRILDSVVPRFQSKGKVE